MRRIRLFVLVGCCLPLLANGFLSTTHLTSVKLLQTHHHVSFTSSSSSSSSSILKATIAAVGEGEEAVFNNSDNKKETPVLFESFGTGVIRDFKNRWPDYVTTDLKDGCNLQTLSSALFLFFACLAPAIGFGGMCNLATAGQMGAMEFVLSTSVCGVLYAALAPQPIGIIGPTGPNLAFTLSLYGLSQSASLPFLPLYAWTGLWTAGYLGLAAMTSASHLVQYLTRFTDEILNVLLSVMFIFDGLVDIFGKTLGVPASVCSGPQALLTIGCSLVTFGTATVLKGMVNTAYFTRRLRKQLSNFAPAIAVVIGSLMTNYLGHNKYDIPLAALSLPTEFASTAGRPWLVPLTALPVWARWAAALPALLGTMLMFLTQNITSRLNNNPNYKMTKGKRKTVLDGMHGDLLVVSILTALTSIVGLPWMVGATTRSAAHVRSLLKVSSDDGSIKRTLEQRLSGVGIHTLIGLCVLFPTPRMWLSQVPLPVLSGVLLYLGFTSLQGLDLWNRMRGVLKIDTDSTKAYNNNSGKVVTASQVSRLTWIQMGAVAVLMKMTKSKWGVVSPLLVALLPLLRYGLVKTNVIPKASMQVLDGMDVANDGDDDNEETTTTTSIE